MAWPALAAAGPLDTGSDLAVSWDNTLAVIAARRLAYRESDRYGYAVGPGTGSTYDRGAFTPFRLEWLSELQAGSDALGVKASALGRFEAAETVAALRHPGLGCVASGSAVAPPDCDGWRGGIELREAFLRGATRWGDDQRLSFRLGRHTLIWGESLYFPGNGIAGGQAPTDTSIAEGATAGYAGSTAFRPVGQASVSWRPAADLAVELYDQFEWRPSDVGRLGDVIAIGPHPYARADQVRPDSADQYGIAVKWHAAEADFGLYALSFDAKLPVVATFPAPGQAYFREVFPSGIELYGLSLARLLGPASLGGEISARRGMPLVTGPVPQPPGAGRPLVPRGDTLHGQLSWTAAIPPWQGVTDGMKWSGEVAANHLIAATAEAGRLTADRTRTAAAFRTVLEAQFFQVAPGLDLSLPLGLGFSFLGLSSVDPTMNRGTGDVSVGLTATYAEVWRASLTLTHYIGTAKTVFPYGVIAAGRPLSDADYLSLVIRRTF
jgi:hypothetical protein